MTKPRIYLDYNATAPVRDAAKNAALNAMALVGNASSIHKEGRKVRGLIETAREQVAQLIGAQSKEITFTSGGTEANNLVLASDIGALGKKTKLSATLMSATEHPSLFKATEISKRPVDFIKVGGDGVIDLTHLAVLLKKWQTSSELPALVSIMLVNNETGVIQPIKQIAQIVHQYGGFIHVDAVQALGKMNIDFKAMNIDLMSISAHKVGGILGAGALVIRLGILVDSYIKGGGQELGLRAGTENIPAIAAFGAVVKDVKQEIENISKYKLLQEKLEVMIQEIDVSAVVFSANVDRVYTTTCFAVPHITAERALMSLDLAGIAVSSGSACSSGKVSQSHVLRAMGIENELALCAVRVSYGYKTTLSELEKLVEEYTRIYKRIMQREQIKTFV